MNPTLESAVFTRPATASDILADPKWPTAYPDPSNDCSYKRQPARWPTTASLKALR